MRVSQVNAHFIGVNALRFFLVLLLFSAITGVNIARAETHTGTQVFNQQSYATLKKLHKGQRWMMIFWSVDCPPCFKELALIQKLSKQGAQLPIVIVNVDDSEDISKERQGIIEKFELSSLTHLYFEQGQATKNRYLVDPLWYGELPRSYFIDEAGKLKGKSGLIALKHIEQWLRKVIPT